MRETRLHRRAGILLFELTIYAATIYETLGYAMKHSSAAGLVVFFVAFILARLRFEHAIIGRLE